MSSSAIILAAMLSLAGTEWEIAGRENAFLRFGDDGRLGGNGGCNRFGGGYSAGPDGSFEAPNLMATRMFCSEDVMRFEQAMFDALSRAARYEIEENRLRLFAKSGELLGEFVRRDAK
jgi:heat shock protein HslJ